MEKGDDLNIPTKRILKAAEEVFSEKGYDGSSVSEIATRAGISKTQIFYYFNNKKDLLNELIKDCMSDIKPYKDALWNNVNPDSKSEMLEFVNSLAKLLESKRDIIRIGLIESFKNTSTDINIFEIFSPIFKDSLLRFKKENPDNMDEASKIEYTMNMTFHVLMPLYSFYILSDKFNNYYNLNSGQSKEIFFKSFSETFINYMLGQ